MLDHPVGVRTEFSNRLLNALPAEVLDALRPYLLPVSMVLNQVMHEVGTPIDDVYFVEEGLVSLTADTHDNGAVEVGITGREGLVGVSVLLNRHVIAYHRAFVQVPGSALRVRSGVMRDMADRHPALRDLCLRYQQVMMVQACQAAACNARHELPERLARWLVMTHDRIDGDELPMTQEFMALMLGVRRAGVSVVTNALQAQGLIRQARGRIVVVNRAALETEACACYRLIEACRKQVMGDAG